VLEIKRKQASNSRAAAQVQLDSGTHGADSVAVQPLEIHARIGELLERRRRVSRPVHTQTRIGLKTHLPDFLANVFALAVAIRPDDQNGCVFALVSKVFGNAFHLLHVAGRPTLDMDATMLAVKSSSGAALCHVVNSGGKSNVKMCPKTDVISIV